MKTLDFFLETLLLSVADMEALNELSRHRRHVILAVERDRNDFFNARAQSTDVVSVLHYAFVVSDLSGHLRRRNIILSNGLLRCQNVFVFFQQSPIDVVFGLEAVFLRKVRAIVCRWR